MRPIGLQFCSFLATYIIFVIKSGSSQNSSESYDNNYLVSKRDASDVTVRIGLIFDEEKTNAAADFLKRANNYFREKQIAQYYKYAIEINANAGCGIALEDGDGAFAATELYYYKNVSAFFGPACASDIEFISRMISVWNILEFNFYHDFYLMKYTKEPQLVQISTMSAVNFALNLVAVLTILGWQKIALITCSACFQDTKNNIFSGNTVLMRFEIIRDVLDDRRITVLDYFDISQSEPTPEELAAQLLKIKTKARILVSIFGDFFSDYRTYLTAMEMAEMREDEYMTILTLGTYIISDNLREHKQLQSPWRDADASSPHFLNPILLYNDFYNATALTRFAKEMDLTGVSASDQMAYIHLFESFWLYVYSLENAFRITSNFEIYKNSSYIRSLMSNHQIEGPFGLIVLDTTMHRLAPYRILRFNETNDTFDDIVKIITTTDAENCFLSNTETSCAMLIGKIDENYDYFDKLPPDIPQCGFAGELCDQREC